MLAIPEMECKRVLACTGRLLKTHTDVTAHTDEKNSEKILVNRKVFCTFTIYYNIGDGRKEENGMTAAYRRMKLVSILVVRGHGSIIPSLQFHTYNPACISAILPDCLQKVLKGY